VPTPRAFLLSSILALALAGCSGAVTLEPTGGGPPDAGAPDAAPPDAGPSCDTTCAGAPWSQDLGGLQNSQVTALGADAAGNVILLASFSGGPNIFGIPENMEAATGVLAKLDPGGHVLWTKALGDTVLASALTVSPSGHVGLTGVLTGPADLGGGSIGPGGGSASTMFVAELDGAGQHVRSHAMHEVSGDPAVSGNDFAMPTHVALDPAGAIVVLGEFVGPLDFGGGDLGPSPPTPYTTDVFVFKVGASGSLLWSQRFGTPHEVDYASGLESSGVAVDDQGSIALALTFFGEAEINGETRMSAGHADIVVARLDPAGGLVFADWFGGPDFDFPGAITTGPDGAIFLTGQSADSVDLGGITLTNPGGAGAPFVAALEPTGQVRWAVPGPQLVGGYGTAVRVDADGHVDAVGVSGPPWQVFLTRLDAQSGAPLDARTLPIATPSDGSTDVQVVCSAIDPRGFGLFGGNFRGSIDLGTGALLSNPNNDPTVWGANAFVAKVAP
jgi:hypothetical protein